MNRTSEILCIVKKNFSVDKFNQDSVDVIKSLTFRARYSYIIDITDTDNVELSLSLLPSTRPFSIDKKPLTKRY